MHQDTLKETHFSRETMSGLEIKLSLLAFVLLLFALFVNLGMLPLRLEEPRRALIALEMLFNKNLIVPTEMGEFYYKKPPLYNWLIIAAYKLFGNYHEFSVRFFSLISYLGMGAAIFAVGKKHVSLAFGVYAGLLYLVSVDLLFYFTAAAGEIDLFYSFLTLVSFFTLFHYYQKKQYFAQFALTYLFGALGTLTKGFPSLVFLGISIPLFLWYHRDLKRLFSWQHFAGIGVYLLIVVGYFAIYAQYNGLENYFADMWSQSSERTVLENGFLKTLTHVVTFPFVTLKNIAPASLLLLFVFRKRIWQILSGNELILFCIMMFAGNILVYWISPGTRSRYVYMLYAFPVMVFTYAFLKGFQELPSRQRIFNIIVTALLILSIVCCAALPFIEVLSVYPGVVPVSVAAGLASIVLLWFHLKIPEYSLIQLILLATVLRLVFDFTVIPHRAVHTGTRQDEIDAAKICAITEGHPLHIFEDSRFSLATVYYIEREREQTLARNYDTQTADYYLADAALLQHHPYERLYTFRYNDQDFYLIKFE